MILTDDRVDEKHCSWGMWRWMSLFSEPSSLLSLIHQKKNIKHTITCDTFWFLKISSINEGSHWFVRNRVVVVFILESRIHYFEYAQSGKVPMDVAVLSILGWILAAICFESENVTAYILCFECIGKNCCPSLCYFPNPDTALLVFPLL